MNIILLAFTLLSTHPITPETHAANSTKSGISDTTLVHNLNEVLVSTNTKDLLQLHRQPASSSTLSAANLTSYALNDMRGAAMLIPSFVMPEYGARYTSAIYVRGVGSRVNAPAVGMYVDDIPLVSKCSFNTHLYGVRRIDVVRGPQGTLYGQNAEGGLVRIFTDNALTKQGTDISLGLASHLQRTVEASHHTTISGIGALTVAGFYNGTNGFQHNTTTGTRADRSNEAGGRLKLIRQLGSRFTLALTADYQWVNQNGFAYGNMDTQSMLPADPTTNIQNTYKRHLAIAAFNMKYNGNNCTINSNTSYQYINDNMLMDQDYTPIDYMSLKQRQVFNAITHEITVKSKNSATWQWISGVFASQQWTRTDAPVGFGDGMTQLMATNISNSIYNGILNGMIKGGTPQSVAQNIIESAGGVSMQLTMAVPGLFHTPQLNAALFHESSIKLASCLTATIGLRYDLARTAINYDTKAIMGVDANIMGINMKRILTSHLKSNTHEVFDELLPKLGIALDLGKNHQYDGYTLGNVYATVSKGYRAGGYNIQMFSDILQKELMDNRKNIMRGDYEIVHNDAEYYDKVNNTIKYKPETSWNYEIGSHLNLIDNRLHIDMAAYMMQIKNQQISKMAASYSFGRMMVNAGKSKSMGIELALRGTTVNNKLSWQASYGYTHAVFKEYDNGKTNFANKRVPYVPAHTLNIGGEYTIPFNNTQPLKAITFGVNTNAMGSIYWDEANTQQQDMYALLNAHITARLKHMTINVWARNITNTKYCTFALESSATGRKTFFGQKGQPTMVGVILNYEF